jgi:hypothetical protein
MRRVGDVLVNVNVVAWIAEEYLLIKCLKVQYNLSPFFLHVAALTLY